ncbi:MAG: glucosaminidase domain-containing protein [Bacteroidales bacterium]|nr:glucosaminidase domain-containing protein [Bacteroidales bacterium]
MRVLPYVIIITIVFSSCHSARLGRSTIATGQADRDIENYIDTYADLAMSEMRRTGVPASITLAQAVIESDYGRSRLARKANNHFGIKCHNGWKGETIYHHDDRRNECFRKYTEVGESFKDHSDFLRQGSRYGFLFDLGLDDYKAWARGLKRAGYATNPGYDRMLIDMIEKNNLHIYDEMVISGNGKIKQEIDISTGLDDISGTGRMEVDNAKSFAEVIDDNFVVSRDNRMELRNRIEYITVREDDTFESIAEEFELLRWEIYRYNDLDDDASLYPGQVLYLQPKRNRAAAGNDYHIIKEGETMYSISQHYGIKLKVLYEKNRIEPGYEPPPGTELWLRKLKPEGL